MAERTEIAWADSTFNPFIGCQEVSPACDHCYAREYAKRFGIAEWGPGKPRVRTSAHNWRQPLRWNAKPFYECDCGWRGDKLDEHTRACGYPEIGRIKPARRRVFCASLADVFDNAVPEQWRVDLFDLIRATPNLDWLLLTKRIGNVGNMLPVPFDFDTIYQNVWLGATIVNQEEADRDIPKLLALPAAVRFVSMEPLLGAVSLKTVGEYTNPNKNINALTGAVTKGTLAMSPSQCSSMVSITFNNPRLHWVIVGGESGTKARPMHPDWVRSLRDQCAAAGVPFLFKQHGEWTEEDPGEGPHSDCAGILPNGDVAKYSEGYVAPWDTGERLEQSGGVRLDGRTLIFRVGKKAAGRLLDGVEHNEFPGGSNA